MKKKHEIRKILGLKQDEIAMLLGVTRAQWGMFEIGKRSLPSAASLLLAKLLEHLYSAESITKQSKIPKEGLTQTQIELFQRENQYQLMRTQREIDNLAEQQEV